MIFENKQNGNGGIISLSELDSEIGRLTYTLFPEDSKLVISFVYINPKFEGQGKGKLLVVEGIKFARELGYKVYPHCSYARSVMMRLLEVDDVFLN